MKIGGNVNCGDVAGHVGAGRDVDCGDVDSGTIVVNPKSDRTGGFFWKNNG